MTPSKVPLLAGDLNFHLIHGSFDHELAHQMASAVFAQLTHVPNTETHGPRHMHYL